MTEAMLGVDSENANGALGLYEGLGFARSAGRRRTGATSSALEPLAVSGRTGSR